MTAVPKVWGGAPEECGKEKFWRQFTMTVSVLTWGAGLYSGPFYKKGALQRKSLESTE